jgi:hypothetical protein
MQWMQCVRTTLIGVLAAGFASASLACRDGARRSVNATVARPDAGALALTAEVAKLQRGAAAVNGPRRPGRNLFEFGAREARARVALPAQPAVNAGRAAPAVLSFKLVGLAEERGGDQPVRTAIVSSGRELLFVKQGDMVDDRYRVISVSTDRVELSDAADGAIVTLALK